MNVGFDVDDTITRCPEFFSVLTQSLVGQGHKVFILTFRTDPDEVAQFLSGEGVAWTEIITCGVDIPAEGFARWKARIVRERDMRVYFEDYCDVVNEVDDSTVVFMPVTRRLGAVGYFDPDEGE